MIEFPETVTALQVTNAALESLLESQEAQIPESLRLMLRNCFELNQGTLDRWVAENSQE